jgi:hypothetical protein
MRRVLIVVVTLLIAACVAQAAGPAAPIEGATAVPALNGMDVIGSKLALFDGLHGRVVFLAP